MLSLRAISEAATCSLPDRLTGRTAAFGEILGTLDIVITGPSRAILIEKAPVFALELYLAPLR